MNTQLDQTMEHASVALAKMDYLTCEALCLDALAAARQRADWAYYGAILLPLQEARRQRRMIAAEGVVRLGTSALKSATADQLLAQIPAGCIVLTAPHTAGDARALAKLARDQRRCIEVLFAQPTATGKWLVQSFVGPSVDHQLDAPAADLTERWLNAGDSPIAITWFLDTCEALGDAALATIDLTQDNPANLAALEACLDVVTDHEILHQRLGSMARRLARITK